MYKLQKLLNCHRRARRNGSEEEIQFKVLILRSAWAAILQPTAEVDNRLSLLNDSKLCTRVVTEKI